jgi:Subtilase family
MSLREEGAVMVDWRRRLAAGLLFAAIAVASMAQVTPGPTRSALTGAPLVVFGANPSAAAATDARQLLRLDGSLRGVARAAPGRLTVSALRNLNPALHVRLAAPATTPDVLVDVVAGTDPAAAQEALESLGMRNVARASNLIGGWLPVTALAQVGQLSGLNQVRASMPRTRASTGPVALQGDFVQGSYAVRSQYPGLTGKGLTIGVMSDSFNCFAYYASNGYSKTGNGYNGYATNGFSPTYADDVASGALPSGVKVIEDASCADFGAPQLPPFSDEGRAMTQIVYAVAPGAQLLYRTASNSEADFAAGITQLQKLGANIIVDDIGYPDEPVFQDGVVAQAIDGVAASGVAYFSAAGNDDRHSYETTTPVFVTQGATRVLNFDTTGASTSTTLPITIPPVAPGEFVLLSVQWDQPYVTGAPGSPGAGNALNFCITSATPNVDYVAQADGAAQLVTYPICTGANSIGADPDLIMAVGNPANASAPTARETLNLAIEWVSGSAPGRVKFILSDNGLGATIDSFDTQSPSVQGHPGAAGAVAVGAAMYYQTPECGTSPAVLEPFSSYGGDPILFDAGGATLATPQYRDKPDLVGPDAVNNTFLGFQLVNGTTPSPPWNSQGLFPTSIAQCQNDTQDPNFFGTSAAAPHVAAAAALLWQANSALTATQIATALKSTALPMAEGAAGSGAGFVQINAALDALPVGPPNLSISQTQIAAGSTATLTWASYGTSACSASGSWSGPQATSGTLAITPAAPGTLTYSLACTGASGTGATATVTLAVQSAAGHHGGGALDFATLALLGGLLLHAIWTWRPARADRNA